MYEIQYAASEAGDFFLHLWMDPDNSGVRKPVGGSPFPVRVSGVRASPTGSFIGGIEAYRSSTGKTDPPSPQPTHPSGQRRASGSFIPPPKASHPKLPAGERLVLKPQLRDEYGNASSAAEGELQAWIEAPDGSTAQLPLKQFSALGAYELSKEPQQKGLHTVHVELLGSPITGSPFCFEVTPAAVVGNRSRLIQVTDPAIVNLPCEILLGVPRQHQARHRFPRIDGIQ